MISDKPFRDIVVDYRDTSDKFRVAALTFGVVGVALLGAKVAAFGWRKWSEKRTRYVSSGCIQYIAAYLHISELPFSPVICICLTVSIQHA